MPHTAAVFYDKIFCYISQACTFASQPSDKMTKIHFGVSVCGGGGGGGGGLIGSWLFFVIFKGILYYYYDISCFQIPILHWIILHFNLLYIWEWNHQGLWMEIRKQKVLGFRIYTQSAYSTVSIFVISSGQYRVTRLKSY